MLPLWLLVGYGKVVWRLLANRLILVIVKPGEHNFSRDFDRNTLKLFPSFSSIKVSVNKRIDGGGFV